MTRGTMTEAIDGELLEGAAAAVHCFTHVIHNNAICQLTSLSTHHPLRWVALPHNFKAFTPIDALLYTLNNGSGRHMRCAASRQYIRRRGERNAAANTAVTLTGCVMLCPVSVVPLHDNNVQKHIRMRAVLPQPVQGCVQRGSNALYKNVNVRLQCATAGVSEAG